MSIGMFSHKLAPPRPKLSSYSIQIPTTLSPMQGSICLLFYVPCDFRLPSPSQAQPRSKFPNRWRYPVVINFHGGGFSLGSPSDDARWASVVTENVKAVVVSVGYRLAPQYPFPTAVEDGVDAILWLLRNGESMDLDCESMALSGFSSGGNLCFTVALKLEAELKKLKAGAGDQNELTTVKPRVLVSWYPSLDYTLSRTVRRASNPGGAERSLSTYFTDLFDAAYLHPLSAVAKDDPYLSPGTANDQILIEGLPKNIVLFTCEYDQLFREGETFRARLEQLGKQVSGRVIPGVKHGWDRSPNPLWADSKAMTAYREACEELKRIFDER